MATPVARPTWLKITSTLAILGVVAWPVLAMLGLLGAVPANSVVNVGIATAVLAYVSIRRIKQDREIALGPDSQNRGLDDSPDEQPPEAAGHGVAE